MTQPPQEPRSIEVPVSLIEEAMDAIETGMDRTVPQCSDYRQMEAVWTKLNNLISQ